MSPAVVTLLLDAKSISILHDQLISFLDLYSAFTSSSSRAKIHTILYLQHPRVQRVQAMEFSPNIAGNPNILCMIHEILHHLFWTTLTLDLALYRGAFAQTFQGLMESFLDDWNKKVSYTVTS